MTQLPSKYHNTFLFDLVGDQVKVCLERLAEQEELYARASDHERRRMKVRGLFTAALTLNATAVWTTKLLLRGVFSMSTQEIFFRTRWRQDPKEWGQNPKSCFARALCGYSIGKDGVCIDRHLERTESAAPTAAAQWREWFELYQSMYGPGETALCLKWHVELMDWIALRRGRPQPWK